MMELSAWLLRVQVFSCGAPYVVRVLLRGFAGPARPLCCTHAFLAAWRVLAACSASVPLVKASLPLPMVFGLQFFQRNERLRARTNPMQRQNPSAQVSL